MPSMDDIYRAKGIICTCVWKCKVFSDKKINEIFRIEVSSIVVASHLNHT